jgi:hypothetical protein
MCVCVFYIFFLINEVVFDLSNGGIFDLNQKKKKGVESLETAINYWEDALAAYQSSSTGSGAVLLTAQEAEFCRSLERVLKVKSSFFFLFFCLF